MTISHKAAAHAWMDANPNVMDTLRRFAKNAQANGVQRMGISFLIERVRWDGIVDKRDKDGYKINNNARAFISRELERRHPELVGFFSKRCVSQELCHV